MSLQIGIVGLPNVGKSTLFNALTRAQVPMANYPFTTTDRHVGVATVPDHRLTDIAAIVNPERVVPTTVEFVDIAGLVRGAHKGEGLGNQFLGHVRNVDAVAMVVRCFHGGEVPHVHGRLDPEDDIQVVELELALADLASVERRLQKVRSQAKSHPRDYAAELDCLERVWEHLQGGRGVRFMEFSEDELAYIRDLNLLTAKPRLYVANVAEKDLPKGGDLCAPVARVARAEGAGMVLLCALLEMELTGWPDEEAAAYRAEVGLEGSGLSVLVHAGYQLLKLITFFTTTGGHEVRAWTLPRNSTALQAAAAVHTDMARGFIRAEVISYADLMALRSLAAAREQGRLRVEGRDYLVQDGDIIHVRFHV
jgi:GTP-binding protein YchF